MKMAATSCVAFGDLHPQQLIAHTAMTESITRMKQVQIWCARPSQQFKH